MGPQLLQLELSPDQAAFLEREAAARGLSVAALVQTLIAASQACAPLPGETIPAGDPLAKRLGSFDGPDDLAVAHDHTLYAEQSG